jgi:hypothetical protein
MGIWAWIQPVDRIWKVVSDNEKGTLCVYNEKSELVLEHKGLTKEEISFIEDNFLQIVAINLSEHTATHSKAIELSKAMPEQNYMYA